MRENRTSGTVAGAPGNRSPYAGERGNTLLFDKVFYMEIAEFYQDVGRYEDAFRFYKIAIEIDPKRTCRLRDVVAQLNQKVIPELPDQSGRAEQICEALKNSYRSTTSDEACENDLNANIKLCQSP